MSNRDSDRIIHDTEEAPTTYRGFRLHDILNEIDEEQAGEGFTEVIRTGVFVDKVIVWTDSGKTKKRNETTFTKTGPFISQIVRQFFDDPTGAIVVSSITANITRNANNTIKDITTTRTRP